ncbi:hypothetical protein HII31_12620 [Pseudocercospora fuligena]|uniref:Uncharacterized protein n=1 Tax=Pseudocercospora fuligena TaxID=685502 RepID=A0A8H6R7L8_9PEZI|nr:hypothetical protein HII31_12620 [Pseudocercospora fuligena]
MEDSTSTSTKGESIKGRPKSLEDLINHSDTIAFATPYNMQSTTTVLLALWYLGSLVTSRATCNKARSTNDTSVASTTDDSDDGDDSYANAMLTCDEAVNCEVYYDPIWPGYLARFKPGMEPGSAWYEENVAPFDDYLQTPNKTDDEYERQFDEDMTKMENDEDIEETSSNSTAVMRRQPSQDDSDDQRKKKKRNVYFNLTRKKRNTHYGHLKPTTVLKKAEKLCTTTQCSGHHTWKNIRSQKGGDVVTGNLILKVHGFFSPKPGHAGQKFHFIKAAAHTAWKRHTLTTDMIIRIVPSLRVGRAFVLRRFVRVSTAATASERTAFRA